MKFNKVAQITLLFWLMKIAITALREFFGDFLIGPLSKAGLSLGTPNSQTEVFLMSFRIFI